METHLRPWTPKYLDSSHNALEMADLKGKIALSANKSLKLSKFRRIQEQKAGSLLPIH